MRVYSQILKITIIMVIAFLVGTISFQPSLAKSISDNDDYLTSNHYRIDGMKKAEREISKSVDKEILKILNSDQEGVIVQADPDNPTTLQLGQDRVFYNMDSGYCGEWAQGVSSWGNEADYSLEQSKAWAYACNLVGSGSAGGWAWVGKCFITEGTESKMANIS